MYESVFFLCGRTAQSVNSRVCLCVSLSGLAWMCVCLSFKGCNDLCVIACLSLFLNISLTELESLCRTLCCVASAPRKQTYYIMAAEQISPALLMCE